jgi:phage gp36-like protein
MTTSTYSVIGDLLLGQIPLPATISAQKFVDDAADEVDSVIGFRYATPLDMSDLGPIPRPARLLIKRIANWLASGRLILALDSSGEDQQLHAYGLKLVSDATTALHQIASGEIVIDGATVISETSVQAKAPVINNLDDESIVEGFYSTFDARNLSYETTVPWRRAGG